MPLQERLPVGPDTAQWPVWATIARIVVTHPAALVRARALVESELAAVDAVASRFRDDSELMRACERSSGEPVEISPLLSELVAAALAAARLTGGDVDPTVGGALRGLGYDRDFALIELGSGTVSRTVTRPSGWRRIELSGSTLRVPPGTCLDLGATAKAFTADRCARVVSSQLGTGVLVSLGGDIATAGEAPAGGWRVLVQDGADEPACTVALPAGTALATSSTKSRRWIAGGLPAHHIVDPRTGLPAPAVLRTVSVVADTCLRANTVSTACLVRGGTALPWLRDLGLPARVVREDGEVVTIGAWPPERG